MIKESFDYRNFLFFLYKTHALSIENALIGALTGPSTWDGVAEMITRARQKDTYARSINKLQLYVHVPFCGRICTFCHCSRELVRRRSDINDYVKALMRQMVSLAPAYKGMDAKLICFGGGTPSILDEQQMTTILDGVDKIFPHPQRKIFTEVNPSSWTASKLAVLSNRGLFRLSIGVQSLDENVLKRVSRPQTLKKVLWCLRSARNANVPYVNVDLIAGLPGQTIKGLIKDIKVLIAEGANSLYVQPYCSLPLKELCGPGETIPEFFKRRDAMMKAAEETLVKEGFHQGVGVYLRNWESEDHREEAYTRLEAAVAGFGPSAKGQFPGAAVYQVSDAKFTGDLPAINASAQDFGYVMSHYAVREIINGLDEQAFLDRFGVSLNQHCGEGLRYLQESGLVAFSKGIWKFSGKWEVRRICEYVALSRILFGKDTLLRLRSRYLKQYEPQRNYYDDNLFLNAYASNWLMTLYYMRGIEKEGL